MRLLPAVRVAVLALLIVAGAAVASHREAAAEGSADGVTDQDLALMVLGPDDFGPLYAGLEQEAGFDREGGDDETVVNAYLFSLFDFGEGFTGVFGAANVAALFETSSDAANFITGAVEELSAETLADGGVFNSRGLENLEGGVLTTATFSEEPLPGVEFLLRQTVVFFRVDRLVGLIVLLRFDDTDVDVEATGLAKSLEARMKDVLSGDLTEPSHDPPPDANCDGEIDSIDAALVLQFGAALIDSLRCQLLADVNGDGSVNAIDAAIILQINAGLV
jgi:hypothetical protein